MIVWNCLDRLAAWALREDARRFRSRVEQEIRDSKKATPLAGNKDSNKAEKTSLPKEFPKTKIITASNPAVTPAATSVTLAVTSAVTSVTPALKEPEPEVSSKALLADLVLTAKKQQFLAGQILAELRKLSKTLEKITAKSRPTPCMLGWRDIWNGQGARRTQRIVMVRVPMRKWWRIVRWNLVARKGSAMFKMTKYLAMRTVKWRIRDGVLKAAIWYFW